MPRKLEWTPNKIELLRQSLHLTNGELAKKFGTSIAMVKKIKHKYGMTKVYRDDTKSYH